MINLYRYRRLPLQAGSTNVFKPFTSTTFSTIFFPTAPNYTPNNNPICRVNKKVFSVSEIKNKYKENRSLERTLTELETTHLPRWRCVKQSGNSELLAHHRQCKDSFKSSLTSEGMRPQFMAVIIFKGCTDIIQYWQ